jgi:hypothetical protein
MKHISELLQEILKGLEEKSNGDESQSQKINLVNEL